MDSKVSSFVEKEIHHKKGPEENKFLDEPHFYTNIMSINNTLWTRKNYNNKHFITNVHWETKERIMNHFQPRFHISEWETTNSFYTEFNDKQCF